jgi:hypothetical protein
MSVYRLPDQKLRILRVAAGRVPYLVLTVPIWKKRKGKTRPLANPTAILGSSDFCYRPLDIKSYRYPGTHYKEKYGIS